MPRKSNRRAEGVRQIKYDVITIERRLKLIELVSQQGMSIYRASRTVGINNATAKDIIRKFRKTSSVFVRMEEIEKCHILNDSEENVEQQGPILHEQNQESQNPQENENQEEGGIIIPQFQENPFYFPAMPMMFYYWV